ASIEWHRSQRCQRLFGNGGSHVICVKEVRAERTYREGVNREHHHERKATMSTSTTTHTVLRAEGFSCPSCVAKIEKQVGRLKGVENVKVHFASSRIEIDHDAERASVDEIVAAVAKAGYKATPSAF